MAKGGKEKEAAAAEDAAPRGEHPPPDLEEEKAMIERELAMLHLTARLARAQTTGHALATERASLVDDLEQARNHAGDANLHLSNDLRAKEATIARLEADVARLDESVSAVLARGDERLATLSADAIARQAELRADIEAREAEIAELDAFERTSQALAKELDGKEALRDAQRRSHLAALERVARDAEAEREADELEAASQLKRTKAEVRAATDASLAGATKRAMAECARMGGELAFQEHETERLLERDERAAADAAASRRRRRELDEASRELAAANLARAKTVEALKLRVRREEAAEKLERERFESSVGASASDRAKLREKRNARARDDAAIARNIAEAAAERDEAVAEIQARGGGEAERKEALAFLQKCAADAEVERRRRREGRGEGEGEEDEGEDFDRLRRALFVLRAALGEEEGDSNAREAKGGRVAELGTLLEVLFPREERGRVSMR
jgi:hypothetical protein